MTVCILCGGHDFNRVFVNEWVEIIRCVRCGLVRQRDCAGALAKLDESFDTVNAYYERRISLSKREIRFDQDRLTRTSDILQEIGRLLGYGNRLLDVGCGNGEFISALRDLGIDASGVEPDPLRASFARKRSGAQVLASPYKQELFPDCSFEAITFIQVLEHMENPLEVLSFAYKHLKPAGWLFIDVPSFDNPRIIVYRFTRFTWLVRRDFISSHCYYFTRSTLSELVQIAGFTILKVQTGRYSVKFGANRLLKAIDKLANHAGVGGILLIAQKGGVV